MRTRRPLLCVAGTALLLLGCDSSHNPMSPSAAMSPSGPAANTMSAEWRRALAGKHVLIADQFNNRVIEVDASGNILWHFGLGPNDISARSIVGVNDAERISEDLTLMAGTGAPPGTEPLCPSGCADNRVIIVDRRGHIVWQYGQFGVTGSGPDQLNTPVQATYLPNGHVLITDQVNDRIIEVTRRHHIVFQYGETGVAGAGPNQLNNPNSAELLENGHILIGDLNNNRAIEITRGGSIVATFTGGGTFSGVAFASRLPDGHTLITDSNNNRIVEVDANDKIVWADTTNLQKGSNANPLPTRAVRLANGTTLISDQFNDRVTLVDHAKHILAQLGHLNQPGYGTANTQQGLGAPYDAKVIGDFTGLTSPGRQHDHDDDGDDQD